MRGADWGICYIRNYAYHLPALLLRGKSHAFLQPANTLLISLLFLPVLTLQIGVMRHAVRSLLRPLPISRLVAPRRSAGYGPRIAMAGVSTASHHANGKPNHWHGAGAAEFDMRSECLLGFLSSYYQWRA